MHTEQAGAALYRFLWTAPNTPAAATPELFDGYTSEITSELNTVSAALFGQIDWAITDRLHLLPGLRFNYDQKDVDFDRARRRAGRQRRRLRSKRSCSASIGRRRSKPTSTTPTFRGS